MPVHFQDDHSSGKTGGSGNCQGIQFSLGSIGENQESNKRFEKVRGFFSLQSFKIQTVYLVLLDRRQRY